MISSTKNFIVGASHGHHDAAIALINRDTRRLDFCEMSERANLDKNSSKPHPFLSFLKGLNETAFYERSRFRQARQWLSGEPIRQKPRGYDHYVEHHWAHAAASYYTRPARWYQEPVCVVIDAIGEFDTASIWFHKKKVWSQQYPVSLGLFYSAITKYLGFKPNRDEHLTMALAGMNDKKQGFDTAFAMLREKVQAGTNFHKGLDAETVALLNYYTSETVASAAQRVLEEEVLKIMSIARKYSPNLCYGGGVALNCVANAKIVPHFDDIWIFPNPGDAGAALGAAVAVFDQQLHYENNFLGTEITRSINPKEVAKHILKHGIAGVASGRGEFGPRALGNRSLLSDPRGAVAGKIYEIKQRPNFSPLAPVILEEEFDKYFTGKKNNEMSFVCETNEEIRWSWPSVCHDDGSARVQCVPANDKSVIRKILEEWFELTACPMLINTSLNLRHKPIVSDIIDAVKFEKSTNVKVF